MPTRPKTHKPHGDKPQQAYERQRGSACKRGYGRGWARDKDWFLQTEIANSSDPYCRYCGRNDATMVDHAIPPMRFHVIGTPEYMRMFNDSSLYVISCGSCNSKKGECTPAELAKKEPEMYRKLVAILAERGIRI